MWESYLMMFTEFLLSIKIKRIEIDEYNDWVGSPINYTVSSTALLQKVYPSRGRQKVLARASNKRPHLPQKRPFLPLLLSLSCFSCSCSLCWSGVTRGTVTSSPAFISKGLQSSPTKEAVIHNLGWRSFDTSTKCIFWRNQLLLRFECLPTAQFLWSHLPYLCWIEGRGKAWPVG